MYIIQGDICPNQGRLFYLHKSNFTLQMAGGVGKGLVKVNKQKASIIHFFFHRDNPEMKDIEMDRTKIKAEATKQTQTKGLYQ